jgi:hypothetical protein
MSPVRISIIIFPYICPDPSGLRSMVVTRLDIERSAIDRLRVARQKLQVRAKDENAQQYDDQQQQQFDEPKFHDDL